MGANLKIEPDHGRKLIVALLVILALIAVPFIEITLFIEAGGEIGAPAVLGLTILTAVGGLAIVRAQGLSNFRRMQQVMDRGEPPIAEMVHGMFLALAGVLLLIPGFLTDAVGALLLLPPVRALLGSGLFRMLEKRHQRHQQDDGIIDAEYWEEHEDQDQSRTVTRVEVIEKRDRPEH